MSRPYSRGGCDMQRLQRLQMRDYAHCCASLISCIQVSRGSGRCIGSSAIWSANSGDGLAQRRPGRDASGPPHASSDGHDPGRAAVRNGSSPCMRILTVCICTGRASFLCYLLGAAEARSACAVDLLENADHLAGALVVGRQGLVVFLRADLAREEETAGVADDGVRRRLEDNGERLDPA